MKNKITVLAAACATAGVSWLFRDRPPFGKPLWERRNHQGKALTLWQGPAWVLGFAGGVAAAATQNATKTKTRTITQPKAHTNSLATLTAVGAGAAAGLLDDLAERQANQKIKGLKGHLTALRNGQVTTGMVKVGVIGGGALASAVLLGRGQQKREILTNTVVIAAAANLANLLDLRALRVAKVGAVVAGVGLKSPASQYNSLAAIGAILPLVNAEAKSNAMLGDCGANAIGANWGVQICLNNSLRGKLFWALGLVGLNLLSEKVSFSNVIAATPGLKQIDLFGRQQ